MLRRTTLIWLLITTALGFGLYQIKYEVQSQEERLARINRQILDNEEAIQVLNAEWSYLNRPDWLAEMARRYLEMNPVTPAQFTQLASLPERSPVVEAAEHAPAQPAAKPVPVKASPAQPSRLQPTAVAAQPAPKPVVVHAPAPAKPIQSPVHAASTAAKPGMQTAAYSPPPAPQPQKQRATVLSSPSVLVAGLLQALDQASAATAVPATIRQEGFAGAK